MVLRYACYLVLLPSATFIGFHQYPVRKMTGKFCSYHAVGNCDSNLITVPFGVTGMKAFSASVPKTFASNGLSCNGIFNALTSFGLIR